VMAMATARWAVVDRGFIQRRSQGDQQ
jgi:hypothetical protein